ncbi:hypothetical protein JD844_031546 [Phrynosoma platyrhinos]|uniref:Cilia- and flagella-associated protein HOATZ n=1 Tax=Phrynosoma platyrhinos TaxID=52577 RepID=A0ABQ7T1E4_PHRPL|nr:hypothetical protein JD844_031546 [Phrynosoma platyrhinos]
METQPSQTRPSAPSLLPPPPSQAAALASAGVPLVFTGSSEKDVALAKSFWNSVTLQPPLESRLSPRRGSGVSGSTTSSRRASSTNNPNGPGKHDISAQLTLDSK